MHTDKSNDGPSAIIALGEFTGGELWTADRGVLPCSNELRLFNGNQPHCTLPFKGERYSLIYFSVFRTRPHGSQRCTTVRSFGVLSTTDGAAVPRLPARGVRDAAQGNSSTRSATTYCCGVLRHRVVSGMMVVCGLFRRGAVDGVAGWTGPP